MDIKKLTIVEVEVQFKVYLSECAKKQIKGNFNDFVEWLKER